MMRIIKNLNDRLNKLNQDTCTQSFINEKIESENEYSYKELVKIRFDPDSSPKAWEHYIKYYSTDAFGKADNDEQYNLNFDDLHYYVYVAPRKYLDSPHLKYNRLHAFPKHTKPIGYDEDNRCIYPPTVSLSGDVDFNFNMTHYRKFMQIVNNDDSVNETIKRAIKEILIWLRDNMHHSLINFSLMQSMGNMQGFKGGNFCEGDRLDRFVFFLNEYYHIAHKYRTNTSVASNASPQNRDALIAYLNIFVDVYDYCNKIYFLTVEEKLINDLIISGSKSIDSAYRVIEYIELAIRFWEVKLKYFNEKDLSQES